MSYLETIRNYALQGLGCSEGITYAEGCDAVADTTRALGFMALGAGLAVAVGMDRPLIGTTIALPSLILGMMTNTNRQNAQRSREAYERNDISQEHL